MDWLYSALIGSSANNAKARGRRGGKQISFM
jgi:hypothetical protein